MIMNQNVSFAAVSGSDVVKSAQSSPSASTFQERLDAYSFNGCINADDITYLVCGGHDGTTTPEFLSRVRQIHQKCSQCNNCSRELCALRFATMCLEDIDKNNIAPDTAVSQLENWAASKGIRI